MADLLERLLSHAGIDIVTIERRTKDIESFRTKVTQEDKAKKYKNLIDITDLSGIRIISYLQEDCSKISNLICDEFKVDLKNSINKKISLNTDQFGYISDHYVVELSDARCALRELTPFRGMKAEIQVRTVLQHTWAAVDHKLRYKSKREVPQELQRRLFRISALLETADDEFSYLAAQAAELRRSYSESIERGQLEIPVNADSILEFIDTSELIIELRNLNGIKDIIHPMINPKPIINICDELEIQSIDDLSRRIKIGIDIISSKSERIRNGYKETNAKPSIATLIRMAAIMGTPEVDKEEIFGRSPYPQVYSPLLE